MLSARKAIERSWNILFLFPRYNHLATNRPSHVLQPRLRYSRSYVQDHVNLPLKEQSHSAINNRNRREFFEKNRVSDAEGYYQNSMRTHDIQTVYHKLRQIALVGNYPVTQACVNILVKERGERPNLRMYEALLLANADHANGSASEVVRILGEMEKVGIKPDAATYHAILRV